MRGFSTTGGTSFDLRDIGFVSANEATFVGGSSGGVLTVTDGTHTAHITLLGDYTTSTFVASSDGSGGVIIVDPPRTSATGFTQTMASMPRTASGALLAPSHMARGAELMLMAGRSHSA